MIVTLASVVGCDSSRNSHPTPPPRVRFAQPATSTSAVRANDLAGHAPPTRCREPWQLAADAVRAEVIGRMPGTDPATMSLEQEQFDRRSEPLDVDGDGHPDVVLVRRGTTNVVHFVFVTKDACPHLVGEIVAAEILGIECLGTSHHGLCDVTASRLMIHGENERSTWIFSGTRYEQDANSIELGPRRSKFR